MRYKFLGMLSFYMKDFHCPKPPKYTKKQLPSLSASLFQAGFFRSFVIKQEHSPG